MKRRTFFLFINNFLSQNSISLFFAFSSFSLLRFLRPFSCFSLNFELSSRKLPNYSPFIVSSISIMWSLRNRTSVLFYVLFCSVLFHVLSEFVVVLLFGSLNWTMNLSNGKGSMSTVTSGGPVKSGDAVSDQFPAGLRVLVVDDDPTCLMILEKMLRTCLYEGTQSVSFPIGNSPLSLSSISLRRFGRSIRWTKKKEEKKKRN